MVTITKEPKPRLEPILLSPEEQIEVQKIMTNSYRSSTRSTKMGKICGMCMCGSITYYDHYRDDKRCHFMIYDCDGCQKVERYCSSCLELEK